MKILLLLLLEQRGGGDARKTLGATQLNSTQKSKSKSRGKNSPVQWGSFRDKKDEDEKRGRLVGRLWRQKKKKKFIFIRVHQQQQPLQSKFICFISDRKAVLHPPIYLNHFYFSPFSVQNSSIKSKRKIEVVLRSKNLKREKKVKHCKCLSFKFKNNRKKKFPENLSGEPSFGWKKVCSTSSFEKKLQNQLFCDCHQHFHLLILFCECQTQPVDQTRHILLSGTL